MLEKKKVILKDERSSKKIKKKIICSCVKKGKGLSKRNKWKERGEDKEKVLEEKKKVFVIK